MFSAKKGKAKQLRGIPFLESGSREKMTMTTTMASSGREAGRGGVDDLSPDPWHSATTRSFRLDGSSDSRLAISGGAAQQHAARGLGSQLRCTSLDSGLIGEEDERQTNQRRGAAHRWMRLHRHQASKLGEAGGELQVSLSAMATRPHRFVRRLCLVDEPT